MKIVIAPDSFKESLSAKQVCESVEAGFAQVFPDAEYVHLPLADGGEGTVDVLLEALDGKKQRLQTTDAIGRECTAYWASLEQQVESKPVNTALIEFAQASGLDRLTVQERSPLTASSFGTGLLIRDALDKGVDQIIIGLGGSATNDAGAGIFQALGGKLLDKQGNELSGGGAALSKLASIDLDDLHPRCKEVTFVVACDVNNPLCGDNGASAVFGPQKGASQAQVEQLDTAIEHFADIAKAHTGICHRDTAGFGAAGGTPLGLSLAFNIQIKAGIEMVLDALDADKVLEGASLVMTGEGQMDNQTLQGKTPFGIAQRAQQLNIPIIGIAGSLGKDVEKLYGSMSSVFGTVRSPQSLDQVLSEANQNLTRCARNIAATLKLGSQIFNEK
ncbi:glycerate kinase [Vibrio sp. 10N.261.46.E12]|uniref:glycerate kinase n=1 Tax=unclassified Vibrio TaxID=2614977 RepID=UPI0009776806|nr:MULTISPECIES: glycerate kinase [unclassified Vibrio]OMO34845.1 glycerate kinase [Vibrio sp. 10N.261.45.E1]PMJ24289.1 glycerate kinase [Vibrio sp. 10N.286.45.B6]PML85646.1 glycerate kinase [Vibrio sp. 10N.261.49.E11]PMM66140.1 glycerate kinase [Vibrio sp. 10N.261.46.F12]PMM81961.1 glycerate kinase [Vibrio sp. 10N.261.46.E8]